MLYAVAGALILHGSCIEPPEKEESYVVVLSVDGFRHDYPELYNTPNLDRMAEEGTKAEALIPAFPSFTFPNHYSMATGLYPDNHGIVMNNFYCGQLDATYRIGDPEATGNADFYGGEPIWVTAENQGVKTATYFWVGADAPISGVRPSRWKSYDSSVSFESRIDSVVSWLSLPRGERPGLVMFYFDEPDSQGHSTGPVSDKTGKMVEYIDSLTGVLIEELGELPHSDNIDLIVTSDHGMGEVSHNRYIDLLEYTGWHWAEKRHGSNPVYIIRPREKYSDTLYTALSNVDNLQIIKNEELPCRLNFGSHPRALDMTVMADSGWSIGFGDPTSYHSGGAHGYDPSNRDMHTIFYATGPSFRKGHTHQPFEIVDIYYLLCSILELEPASCDGDPQRVKGMLK